MADTSTVPCEDCGLTFALREGAGPCQKCVKLSAHSRGSDQYTEISTWEQCAMCSITRRNNMHCTYRGTERIFTCGSPRCKAAVGGDPRLPTHNVPSTVLDRAAATRSRFKLAASNKGPTSALSTQVLLRHEHGDGEPGDDKFMIAWQVRMKRSLNADLGQGAKAWSSSVLLQDVKAELTGQISMQWERHKTSPLSPEHIDIRWANNRMPIPDTSNLTVGEFYARHSTNENATIYTGSVPAVWRTLAASVKRKYGFMALELYIDQESWAQSTEILEDDMTSEFSSGILHSVQNTRKRSAPELGSSIGKRAKASGIASRVALRSEFCPAGLTGSPAQIFQRSSVTLKKIIFVVDPVTGQPELEDADETVRGKVRDTPLNSGAMKSAYDFQGSDGKRYVLKRFFRLREETENAPPDELPFTVEEHAVQIQAEASRLAVSAWFLDAFFKHTGALNVPVYKDLAFAKAWLGKEIDCPTPASGIKEITVGSPGLTWLVEERRSTTVEHFTYTLSHKSKKKDLRSSTIYAFAHFVWGHGNRNLVLADIQGTNALVRGKDGMVLFDPMMHTKTGNSGVGDFGVEGIQSFLGDHTCSDICRRLGLDKTAPLTLNESEPNDSDLDPKDATNGSGNEDDMDLSDSP